MYLSISMLHPSPACSAPQPADLWGGLSRFHSPQVSSRFSQQGALQEMEGGEQHEGGYLFTPLPLLVLVVAESFHQRAQPCQGALFTQLSLQGSLSTPSPCPFGLRW